MSRRVSVVTGSSIGAVSVAVTRAQRARRRGGERRGPWPLRCPRGTAVGLRSKAPRIVSARPSPIPSSSISRSRASSASISRRSSAYSIRASWTRAPQPPSVRRTTRLVVPRSETVRIRPPLCRGRSRGRSRRPRGAPRCPALARSRRERGRGTRVRRRRRR